MRIVWRALKVLSSVVLVGAAASSPALAGDRPTPDSANCVWCTNSCYEALWYCIYECPQFVSNVCMTTGCLGENGVMYPKKMVCAEEE